MSTKFLLVLFVLLTGVLAAGCGATEPDTTAAKFAGTWTGQMGFSDAPGEEQDIVINLPDDCAPGAVCGDLTSPSIACSFELTMEEVKGEVFYYSFSRSLSGDGDCASAVGSRGTLTRKADGTLFREHQGPGFVASGSLTRQ